jgi:hypothetical protein
VFDQTHSHTKHSIMENHKVTKVESLLLSDHLVEMILRYCVLYPIINKGRYSSVVSTYFKHFFQAIYLIPSLPSSRIGIDELRKMIEIHQDGLESMTYLPHHYYSLDFVYNSLNNLKAAMNGPDDEDYKALKKQTINNCRQIISVYDRPDFPKLRYDHNIEVLRRFLQSVNNALL